jgi:hypothetical protein
VFEGCCFLRTASWKLKRFFFYEAFGLQQLAAGINVNQSAQTSDDELKVESIKS